MHSFSLAVFFAYLSLFSCQSWQPCYLDTTVPGMDIADDATQFPNPFLWYTNTTYPGVTLPGPWIQNKCGWKANDGVFHWTPQKNTCYLNGQGYPLTGYPNCNNHKFANNETEYNRIMTKFMDYSVKYAKSVANDDGSTAHVASFSVGGVPYQAAMSIGHGVLSGLCGNCFLIRYNNNYVFQLQTDVRAWSLELSGGAHYWMANDNFGGTCHIPDVLQINCDDALNSLAGSNPITASTSSSSTTTATTNTQSTAASSTQSTATTSTQSTPTTSTTTTTTATQPSGCPFTKATVLREKKLRKKSRQISF